MLRCKKCHRLGLFRSINPNTGVCLDCERDEMCFSAVHPTAKQEETAVIHIPRYFIGNGMRYIKTEIFELVHVDVSADFDFSKIKLRDDVVFSSDNKNIDVSIKFGSLVGILEDCVVRESVHDSLERKLPIFSQVCGYDADERCVDVCVAIYKIENYDYSPEYDKHFDDIDPFDISYC